MRITIYWVTENARIIDNIRQRFGIVEGMTVNGENIVTVTDDGLAELKNTKPTASYSCVTNENSKL